MIYFILIFPYLWWLNLLVVICCIHYKSDLVLENKNSKYYTKQNLLLFLAKSKIYFYIFLMHCAIRNIEWHRKNIRKVYISRKFTDKCVQQTSWLVIQYACLEHCTGLHRSHGSEVASTIFHIYQKSVKFLLCE